MSGAADRSRDVIVIGSRVAGASTALLLARRGYRVLLIDRRRPGSDTLSTHALMRAAVLQLGRWNLLDRVIASGAPPVNEAWIHYGENVERIELRNESGPDPLFAPRRHVLDAILVDAAAESGVEVRFGVEASELLFDGAGRVLGVRGVDGEGEEFVERARFTIGADGMRSLVAREVGAPILRRGAGSSGLVYGYFEGVGADRYDWYYRPGVAAGVLPTNGGEACVWAGTSSERFMRSLRWDLEGAFRTLLAEAAPDAVDAVLGSRRSGRLRGFPGIPGFERQAWGDGWALVGDASHFKDPLSAHGITDALRDAELLARAIDGTLRGDTGEAVALADYQALRDRLSRGTFDISDSVASFGWDLDGLRELLIALSRSMKDEVRLVSRLDGERCTPAA